MTRHKDPEKKTAKLEIGWREHVGLPDLGIKNLRAKIDTGARTSALHAIDLKPFEKDGAPWIEFNVPLTGEPRSKRYAAPVKDEREIKNTSGIPEKRYVVELVLVLGKRHWHIDVSLADRELMTFDMILGRTAIRGRRIVVDPGHSFMVGPPIWEPKPLQNVTILGRAQTKNSSKGYIL